MVKTEPESHVRRVARVVAQGLLQAWALAALGFAPALLARRRQLRRSGCDRSGGARGTDVRPGGLEKVEDPDPLRVELRTGFNDYYLVARTEEEEQVPEGLLLMQLEPVGVRLRR